MAQEKESNRPNRELNKNEKKIKKRDWVLPWPTCNCLQRKVRWSHAFEGKKIHLHNLSFLYSTSGYHDSPCYSVKWSHIKNLTLSWVMKIELYDKQT